MDDMLSIAKLGVEAEAFIRSPIGRYLHEKALIEIEEATEVLIDTPPDDEKRNREVRNQIHVARMFLVWLTEAVNVGAAAHENLKMQE